MDRIAKSSDDSLVRIVVRNVYAPEESLPLQVDRSMLICELKKRISMDFPNKPSTKEQKLIFGGKILDENDSLERVLQRHQVEDAPGDDDGSANAVFHLLVPSSRVKVTEPAPVSTKSSARVADETVATPQRLDARADTNETANHANHRAAQPEVRSPRAFSPSEPGATNGGTSATSMPSAHDLLVRQMLVQQQTLIWMQIQHLQHLKHYYETHTANSHADRMSNEPVHPTPHYQYAAQAPHPTNPYGVPENRGQGQMRQEHAINRPAPVGQERGAGVHNPGGAPHQLGQNDPEARGFVQRVIREVGPLVDLHLAFKMAFMLFIFGHDLPPYRLFFISWLALGAYLHITGIARKLIEIVLRSTEGYPRRNGVNNPRQVGGVNGGHDAGAHRDVNDAENAEAQGREMLHLIQISTDRGFFQDIKSFMQAFLLSLAPTWHPHPVGHQPAPAPGRAQDDARGEGMFAFQGI